MDKQTQKSAVLAYMLAGNRINSMKAFKLFGATRLSAIIFVLKDEDFPICKEMKTEKNRYGEKTTFAEYWISDDYLKKLEAENVRN